MTRPGEYPAGFIESWVPPDAVDAAGGADTGRLIGAPTAAAANDTLLPFTPNASSPGITDGLTCLPPEIVSKCKCGAVDAPLPGSSVSPPLVPNAIPGPTS